MTKKIFLTEIEKDITLQPREAIDSGYVEELSEEQREGAKLPPITVFSERGDSPFILADGWHRYESALSLSFKDIEAEVRIGTREDAFLYSRGANVRHGKRRTNADKRRAIVSMLEHPVYSQWSDNRIAETCHASHPTVGAIRKQVVNFTTEKKTTNTGTKKTEPKKEPEEKRIGKDGRKQAASKKVKDESEPTITKAVQHWLDMSKEWKSFAGVLHSTLTKKNSAYGFCPPHLVKALAQLHKSLGLKLCPSCKGKKCDDCARFGVIMENPFPAKP